MIFFAIFFVLIFAISCRYEVLQGIFGDIDQSPSFNGEFKPKAGATTLIHQNTLDLEKEILIFFGEDFQGSENNKLETVWSYSGFENVGSGSFQKLSFVKADGEIQAGFKNKKFSSGIKMLNTKNQYFEYYFFGGISTFQKFQTQISYPTNDLWKYVINDGQTESAYYHTLVIDDTKFATENKPGGRYKHVFLKAEQFALILGGYGFLTEPSDNAEKTNTFALNDIWGATYDESTSKYNFNLVTGCINYYSYQIEEKRRDGNNFIERFGHSAAIISDTPSETAILVFGGARCGGNVEKCLLNDVIKLEFRLGEGGDGSPSYVKFDSYSHVGGKPADSDEIAFPNYLKGEERIGGRRDTHMMYLTTVGNELEFAFVGGFGLGNSQREGNRIGIRGDEWRMFYNQDEKASRWSFVGREETRFNNVVPYEDSRKAIYGGITDFVGVYDTNTFYFGYGRGYVQRLNETQLGYLNYFLKLPMNLGISYTQNKFTCFGTSGNERDYPNQFQFVYDKTEGNGGDFVCECRPGYYGYSPYHEACNLCDPTIDCKGDLQAECLTFNDAKQCVCNGTYSITEGSCFDEVITCGNYLQDDYEVCSYGNGDCKDDGTCECQDAFGGDNCEILKCGVILNIDDNKEKICGGHGTCQLVEDSFNVTECICDTSYSGENCELWQCYGLFQTDENVCSGNGECTSPASCECKDGWGGPFCNIMLCNGIPSTNDSVCSNHGQCIGPNECFCESTLFKTIYDGNDCENEAFTVTMQWILTGSGIGGIVFIILLFLIAIVIAFCCLMGSFQRKLKKMENRKTTTQLEDIEVNEMNKQIANLKVNKDLFKINMEDIQISSKIGQGGFATVFLGEYQHMKVAFKAFNTDFLFKTTDGETNDFENFEKELQLFSSLNHTNIPRFYGASLKPPRCGIVMEYCPNGDLESYLKKNKCSFEEKMKFMDGIVKGMIFLHSKNLIHRDLKPENILLGDNNVIKICDFGLSRIDNDTKKTQAIGTNLYMSPEVFLGRTYGKSSDVFSFGMILYVCISENFIPYPSMTMETQIKISNDPTFRPDVMKINKTIRDKYPWVVNLIKDCYSHEPNDRPTFKDVLSRIESNMK